MDRNLEGRTVKGQIAIAKMAHAEEGGPASRVLTFTMARAAAILQARACASVMGWGWISPWHRHRATHGTVVSQSLCTGGSNRRGTVSADERAHLAHA